MEEVVYQFLLQTAGYPRASVVSDTSVLYPESESRPAYAIVDPETAEPLAIIHVVGGVDASGLYAASADADANAKSLRPATRGYVVRVDFKGRTDKEKIQFYQAKDKGELYPLSAATFPDLDTLRVNAKLSAPKSAKISRVATAPIDQSPMSDEALLGLEEKPDAAASKAIKTKRAGLWLGILLILLAIADVALTRLTGEPLLQVSQVLLIVGAVLAFVLS